MDNFYEKKSYRIYMVTEYFLENLRSLMDSRELKDSQLSRMLGLNKDIVNSWFRNKSKPNDKTLEELARFFNVESYCFFMRPGSQGGIKSIERTDDFDVFINELAEKNLSEDELEKFRLMGGSREYVRALRQNVEEDKIYVSPWYLKLNRAVKEYTNCDLDKKFRELSNISSDNKDQKNAKSS